MTTRLGKALAGFVDNRTAPNTQNKIGLLGDADGTIEITGRDGFVYVRLSTGSERMAVLNAGRVATSSEMLNIPVVIGRDAALGLWRIIDLVRDNVGSSTIGRTLTTTDVNGSPQTISVNSYQPASPVGQANTLVMLSPTGASTTNITNAFYNNNTIYITQSGNNVDLLADQLAKRRSWIGL